MNNLTLIRDIQNNNLDPEQLLKCLDIPQNYVLSNAIKQIVKLRLNSNETIDKLVKLSILMEEENKLMGIYTVGHLATAALFKIDSSYALEKFKEVMTSLKEWDQEVIRKLNESDLFDE